MAKLRFGSMEIKAELPKMGSEQPNLGRDESKSEPRLPDYDFADLVQKAIAMMPKPEAPAPSASMREDYPRVDLSPLEGAVSSQAERLMEHNDRLKALEQAEKNVCKCSPIVMPEVKQITHVKDVSPDVLKQCDAMIEKSRMNLNLDMNGLKRQNHKQKTINLVLSGALILTILLHLL